LGRRIEVSNRAVCHLTQTTDATHTLHPRKPPPVPDVLGRIQGIGPRYCPSVEDKVVRFADKPHHQLHLEPEGLATDEIYLNGFSTSLPEEVQRDAIATVPGSSTAEMLRPDMPSSTTTSSRPSLPRRWRCAPSRVSTWPADQRDLGLRGGRRPGPRSQGSMPHSPRRGEAAFVPRRDEAYIGVMVDDLVTRGTAEPYRLFTSQAEYRLLLRHDNADERLAGHGHRLG
jgi:tRNA uridine 5-carboxymethylaminomethyl modification enzyme